jgi:PBS lyase HEAT-like repeat-containing protein
MLGAVTPVYVAFVIGATAEAPGAPDTALYCTRFSAHSNIEEGQVVSVALARGLELRVVPNTAHGWSITVTERGSNQDFAWIVSPPFDPAPRLLIGAGYPASAKQSAKTDRWLYFVPTLAEYQRALHVNAQWRSRRLSLPMYLDGLRGGSFEIGTLRIGVKAFGVKTTADALESIDLEGEACVPVGPTLFAAGDQRPPRDEKLPIEELIDRFKREQFFWRQFEIGERLVASGDRRIIGELDAWLTHPDLRIRGNVAFVLGRLGDARGYTTLLEIVGTPSSQEVGPAAASARWTTLRQISGERYYAAHLLGELKDPRAVPLLIALLNDDDVSAAAQRAINRIEGK